MLSLTATACRSCRSILEREFSVSWSSSCAHWDLGCPGAPCLLNPAARGTQVDLRTCPWDDRGCKAQGERNCRAWDPSNAREILRHAHARGMPGRGPRSAKIFGFELDTLGNTMPNECLQK